MIRRFLNTTMMHGHIAGRRIEIKTDCFQIAVNGGKTTIFCFDFYEETNVPIPDPKKFVRLVFDHECEITDEVVRIEITAPDVELTIEPKDGCAIIEDKLPLPYVKDVDLVDAIQTTQIMIQNMETRRDADCGSVKSKRLYNNLIQHYRNTLDDFQRELRQKTEKKNG